MRDKVGCPGVMCRVCVMQCGHLPTQDVLFCRCWGPLLPALLHTQGVHSNQRAAQLFARKLPPISLPLSLLTAGGWGSIGSALDRSPAIMLVLDALDDPATRVLKGRDGATNADAVAVNARVAAISNFMVVSLAAVTASNKLVEMRCACADRGA